MDANTNFKLEDPTSLGQPKSKEKCWIHCKWGRIICTCNGGNGMDFAMVVTLTIFYLFKIKENYILKNIR